MHISALGFELTRRVHERGGRRADDREGERLPGYQERQREQPSDHRGGVRVRISPSRAAARAAGSDDRLALDHATLTVPSGTVFSLLALARRVNDNAGAARFCRPRPTPGSRRVLAWLLTASTLLLLAWLSGGAQPGGSPGLPLPPRELIVAVALLAAGVRGGVRAAARLRCQHATAGISLGLAFAGLAVAAVLAGKWVVD